MKQSLCSSRVLESISLHPFTSGASSGPTDSNTLSELWMLMAVEAPPPRSQ